MGNKTQLGWSAAGVSAAGTVSGTDGRFAVTGTDGPIPQKNRREWKRILVDLEVDYAHADNYLFAYIQDISATGIFIRTETPELPGTHLNLRFIPPGAEFTMELEGEVIWINTFRPGDKDNLHPGMGVSFVDLEREQRHLLAELVKTIALF